MTKKIGSTVRINGMRYVVANVVLDGSKVPTFILGRVWDQSLWYAKCRRVTRFTHLKRVFDSTHAGLDKDDIMSSANQVMRRL